MKKHFLLINFFAPLALGAAVLTLASLRVTDPWRSLFVNLAAGLIGSMVTVFYIDRIMRRNERYEWTKVLNHVGRQVNILANGTTSSLRQALGLRLPPSWADPDVANDPRRMRKMMLSLIEEQLRPRISQLSEMDQNGWRIFANNMQGSLHDVERILSLFSRNLDPTIMGLILDIHEKARSLWGHYYLWPEMLGVPLTELKPNNRGESMIPLMKATYEQIVRDADQLLKICGNLLREIDQHFPRLAEFVG